MLPGGGEGCDWRLGEARHVPRERLGGGVRRGAVAARYKTFGGE